MPHTLMAEQNQTMWPRIKTFSQCIAATRHFWPQLWRGMNCGVSCTTRLLNDRVWNGQSRGLRDHKNCGGKNCAWGRCWSHFLIRAAWSILSSFLQGKRWTWTSTNVCSTNCWNGSRACGQICTHPKPGACCTIMRPRITPSSFGSFWPKRTSLCCTTRRIRRIWPWLITFYSCASRFTWKVIGLMMCQRSRKL